jgi:hypothetical protein
MTNTGWMKANYELRHIMTGFTIESAGSINTISRTAYVWLNSVEKYVTDTM